MLMAVLSCLAPGTSALSHDMIPVPVQFGNIRVQDELYSRAMRNFDRLETDYYQPVNIFNDVHPSASKEWPGDLEGRIILGLVMEAQATHREPVYLDEIMHLLPEKFNSKGYFGPIQGDTINEQQLSGHGWLLRGLCEYYSWKKDEQVKQYIQQIILNLALPTRGHHKDYPIKPGDRKPRVGDMSGTSQNVVNNWLLSSDIGCDFIFLDGVVQAYGLFPSQELKALIDEMVARFLQVDLVSIKAQTHATLTGLRALIRYDEITGNKRLLAEVIKRYKIYREQGMTENYENFNWFCRPEWTEPCAIIDSYMLAVQLWQHTRNAGYLEDAQHIYYNAICHTQRANGGFGCDNCPGPTDLQLRVKAYEAYWCCTMRGGEGLAQAVRYACFTRGDHVYIPFFHTANASLTIDGRKVEVSETTDYPFGSKVKLIIKPENGNSVMKMHLVVPAWTNGHQILVNGKKVRFTIQHGFASFTLNITGETHIEYSFNMILHARMPLNNIYTRQGSFAIEYGPLMLGYEGKSPVSFNKMPALKRMDTTHWQVSNGESTYELTPVYQLLDEKVREQDYQKQILFISSDQIKQ
jgi:hypothetical protein